MFSKIFDNTFNDDNKKLRKIEREQQLAEKAGGGFFSDYVARCVIPDEHKELYEQIQRKQRNGV